MTRILSIPAALCLLVAGVAFADVNPQTGRSVMRQQVFTYTFSTTSSISGALVGVLPQQGMILKDVVVAQAGAGVGGTSWTATPKRDGTALVSTPGGFTLAAGASKATNTAGSPLGALSLPSGGTRPVIAPFGAASQTITVGTLSAGNAVTIDGVTFTARASGAVFSEFNIGGTATDSATALAAAINLHPWISVRATSSGAVVTVTARRPGTWGNSLALSQTANYTLGASTLAGGFDLEASGGDILTMDVTLSGTYTGAVSGIVQLYFEPMY